MRRRSRGRFCLTGPLASALLLVAPAFAAAQGGDGYLFKQPVMTVKFETGYGFQRASSDAFDEAIRLLTVGRRDFDSPYIGGEFGVRLGEHADLFLSLGYQASSVGSEDREFVDQDLLPINQVTELRQIPAVVGVKYYPMSRGRRLGRFAWVPNTFAPFVRGGVGTVSYTFEQYGDFVDYETLEIFTDTFRSRDNGLLMRLGAGVEITVGNQFLLSVESRYSWADAKMAGDFRNFDRIDLNGLQLIGGLGVRF